MAIIINLKHPLKASTEHSGSEYDDIINNIFLIPSEQNKAL